MSSELRTVARVDAVIEYAMQAAHGAWRVEVVVKRYRTVDEDQLAGPMSYAR